MISITNTLFQALAGGNPYCICIKIYNGNSTVLATTTNYYDLTIDGVLYTSDGTITAIEPPVTSSTVDRELFNFQISDPSFERTSIATSSIINSKVEVRLCFEDANGNVIVTPSDTFLVYKGRVEGVSYAIKTETTGEVTLQVRCSSPLYSLDSKKFILLTKDYIRGRNPNDSSCDTITSLSSSTTLKWGKG